MNTSFILNINNFLFDEKGCIAFNKIYASYNENSVEYTIVKEFDIRIWVSLYRLKIDYERIDARAKQFGVFCGYTGTRTNDNNEKDWGNWKLDLEGKQFWADSFSHCQIRNCVTLKKGKLYTCPTIAHIEHFNKFFGTNLEVSEFDYLDIYKARKYYG